MYIFLFLLFLHVGDNVSHAMYLVPKVLLRKRIGTSEYKNTTPLASRQRSSFPASKARKGSPTICPSLARD